MYDAKERTDIYANGDVRLIEVADVGENEGAIKICRVRIVFQMVPAELEWAQTEQDSLHNTIDTSKS